MPPHVSDERSPLLNNRYSDGDQNDEHEELVEFGEKDPEDPRQWSLRWKYFQVFLIFLIAVICPLASSMFTPGISDIAEDFGTSEQVVLAGQTTFVCMLGIGPLFLAPMSETFGRRRLFLMNLAIFTLLQIPTALCKDVVSFIILRTLAGLFGSVSVANGGGSIADLFETSERAQVLGVFLLGPLLGPTSGSLIGGIIVAELHWSWIFWMIFVMTAAIILTCYFFLNETFGVVILTKRKARLEEQNKNIKYKVKGASEGSIPNKIASVSHLRASNVMKLTIP